MTMSLPSLHVVTHRHTPKILIRYSRLRGFHSIYHKTLLRSNHPRGLRSHSPYPCPNHRHCRCWRSTLPSPIRRVHLVVTLEKMKRAVHKREALESTIFWSETLPQLMRQKKVKMRMFLGQLNDVQTKKNSREKREKKVNRVTVIEGDKNCTSPITVAFAECQDWTWFVVLKKVPPNTTCRKNKVTRVDRQKNEHIQQIQSATPLSPRKTPK